MNRSVEYKMKYRDTQSPARGLLRYNTAKKPDNRSRYPASRIGTANSGTPDGAPRELCGYMIAKGVTQAHLAAYLAITREAYSMYESGKRQMNYEALCKLADYYHVSADYLLGRDTAPPLTEEERLLIGQYRLLDRRGRENVRATVSYEHSSARRRKSEPD